MNNFKLDGLRTIGSTNTQTRRLGYVVEICKILEEEHMPLKILQTRIEDWAYEHNKYLSKHISDKGVLIQSTRSNGAKRYIELAQNLKLIYDISGYLRPSKTGHLIANLALSEIVDNPFLINPKVTTLLFYQLLLLDGDYILEILRLTRNYHYQNEILKEFQQSIVNKLLAMKGMDIHLKLRSQIIDKRQSITSWKKPIKYAEHIVLPRQILYQLT